MTARWQANVLTLFPEMFPGTLGYSLLGRALEEKIWGLTALDIRAFAPDKHQTTDEPGFGGGPGMVLKADVVDRALLSLYPAGRGSNPLIYLSPRGTPLKQDRVKELAAGSEVTLLCGRYEGVDQRVLDVWEVEEVSLGDFVLAGGEVAAMTLIEACVRLLPGVMGESASLEEESFENNLLEYPHYTRPRMWKEREVPEVLLSGHHKEIEAWRRSEAETLTKARRPDLWKKYCKAEIKE